MVFLRVILIIALLIALLLSLRVKLYIRFTDNVCIRVGVGPVVFTLTPKKHKKVVISDFTYEKHQKRLEKEMRKSERKTLKKARRAEKKRKSAELRQKAEAAASNEAAEVENKLGEIIDLLTFICEEFPRLASRLHVGIKRLHIAVGGNDAAETALKYGKIQTAVSLLIELLDNKTKLYPIKKGDAVVYADFLLPRTRCEADISLKLSIYSLLRTGFSALIWLIKSKIKKSTL